MTNLEMRAYYAIPEIAKQLKRIADVLEQAAEATSSSLPVSDDFETTK